MKPQRLDQLADGIFAIIMTLLAFEIRVPDIAGEVTEVALWYSILGLSDIFLTFILSFALLFTYWRAHHFIVSTYAQNLTVGLINYNAVFFFLIILIPFSARFLETYSHTRMGIIIYGINVILIGMTLYFMRRYIERNPVIGTPVLHKDAIISGYVRILFPVFSSIVAILISLYNPTISLVLFTIAILFNLFPATTSWIHRRMGELDEFVIVKEDQNS